MRAGDEIRLGGTELVVTTPGADRPGRQSGAAYYDVASQAGNINNVAGNQSNYYRESNLRYIASRRGRSRRMIVMGLLLFFIGSGIGMYAVLSFQNAIFTSQGFDPPVIPPEYIPLFGAGAFLNLLGIALFIFGLIARSNAKREAHRLGARW